MPTLRSGTSYQVPVPPPPPPIPPIPVPFGPIEANPVVAQPGHRRFSPPFWISGMQPVINEILALPAELQDEVLRPLFTDIAGAGHRLLIKPHTPWQDRRKLAKWGHLPWPISYRRVGAPVGLAIHAGGHLGAVSALPPGLSAIDFLFGDLTTGPDYHWYWRCMKLLVHNNQLTFFTNRDAWTFLHHLSLAPGGTPAHPYPVLNWVRDIELTQFREHNTLAVLDELAKCPRVWFFSMKMCSRCWRQYTPRRVMRKYEGLNARCNRHWPKRPTHPPPPAARWNGRGTFNNIIPLDEAGHPTKWCYWKTNILTPGSVGWQCCDDALRRICMFMSPLSTLDEY